MTTKTVFSFDPLTRHYIGPLTLDESDRCQVAGDWHVPGNCLEVAPPDAPQGTFVVENAGAWELRQYRGSDVVDPVAPVTVPLIVPTVREQVIALTARVQAELDAQAVTYRFDNLADAISYADDQTVPLYFAQGQAFRALRGKVWPMVEAWMDEVLAGTKPVPEWAELQAAMPLIDAAQIDAIVAATEPETAPATKPRKAKK